MKTNLFRMSLAGVLMAAAASAQSSTPLKADIPFDFVAGGKALPAGHYTVDQGTGATVTIRSQEGKGAAVAIVSSVYSPNGRQDARLVFHRYGNTSFLYEVWGPENSGKQLPATRQERQMAAGAMSSSNTVLASLR